MLATAAIYSVTSVGGKAAMQWMPPEQFGAFYFVVLGALTLLFVGISHPSSPANWTARHLAAADRRRLHGTDGGHHFMALAQVEAAYMIAVKRSSLLFGVLYGLCFSVSGIRPSSARRQSDGGRRGGNKPVILRHPGDPMLTRYRNQPPFETGRDGSQIREPMHPAVHGNLQSKLG